MKEERFEVGRHSAKLADQREMLLVFQLHAKQPSPAPAAQLRQLASDPQPA